MDYVAIFSLIAKGLTVVQALYEAEQSAEPALKALTDIVTGAQAGSVTDQQIADTEALLDGMISDFNLDI